MRAGNLSELVYKQGQAGVNKATVTIVFNNEDTGNSPVGFEQCPEVTVTRQVLLGGKSKYLVNGRNTPAAAVQNLFHSVQLNVNNPHFLIMQGRITKVLNMKPNEILGMVEEAAGTRMYETKRVAALKTIEKKQAKVDEITSILEEEITPTLERLRGEKQNYLKWSKNSADLERLERFCIAYEFQNAKKALESNDEGASSMEEQVTELEAKVESYQQQIRNKEKEINESSSKLKGDMDKKLATTKKIEQERSNELVRITSKWKNCQENVQKAQVDLEAAKQLVEETKQAVVEQEQKILDEAASSASIVNEAAAAEEELQRLTNEYQNMSAGIMSKGCNGDEHRTLPEQISQAHADSKAAESKVAQADLKIKHLTKELKALENELKKEGKSAQKLAEKKERATKTAFDIRAQLAELHFSEEEFDGLEKEKNQLDVAIAELEEMVNTLEAKLSGRLGFRYKDPVRGFDRNKVKGLVAKLIEVKDSKHSTALEVVAGNKLFQVVVDEAITGKALLEKGDLKRRVTIIPLDKIKSHHVSHNTSQRAQAIADSLKTTATPAIELVSFDEEVRCAIEYVFGGSIVVDGGKAADEICTSAKIRTVTLDGDVYDPAGTISGGSKNQIGTTLADMSDLLQAKKEVEVKKLLAKEIATKLNELKSSQTSFDKLKSQLELAEAELEAAHKHLSQTNFGMLVEKRDAFTAELAAAQKEVKLMAIEKDAKWKLYEELKDQEAVLTKRREERLASIELAVKNAKLRAAAARKRARDIGSEAQTLTLELESLKAELCAAEEAVKAAQQALDEASNEESESQMLVGGIQASYEEVRSELDILEKNIATFSNELNVLKKEKAELSKLSEAAKLEAKKLSVNIARNRKERLTAEKVVNGMIKKYAWIESEQSAFGVPDGDYDFDENDPEEAVKQLRELKGEQDNLSKKINKKVMGMIEKAEGEYTELLRKRKVVENDKKKIQDVIKELDEKKKSELEVTWRKVNRDFGSIFSTLLPGTSAKLEPPEGMAAWEGLEVKVAFGEVWKESLTELSGGQRSLLALSLILSLLLFKPAPMYILDEVDAALDLSHTQNIGNMLKTHFSQSQFIVVSLKEGMFNNANVIFRTKFIDGVSTVTRTIGIGSSRAQPFRQSNNNDEDYSSAKPSTSRHPRKRGKENTA